MSNAPKVKLSEIQQLLKTHQIQLPTSPQHTSPPVARQLAPILTLSALKPTATALEIGRGLGRLTELLPPRCEKRLAPELDARLHPLLRERFSTAHPHF